MAGFRPIPTHVGGKVENIITSTNAGNTLDLSTSPSAHTITLTTTHLSGGFDGSVDGVNFINASVMIGGTGNDTLTGTNLAGSIWTIGAAFLYTVGTNTLTFSAIETAIGGSNNDIFNISGSRTINLMAAGAINSCCEFGDAEWHDGRAGAAYARFCRTASVIRMDRRDDGLGDRC